MGGIEKRIHDNFNIEFINFIEKRFNTIILDLLDPTNEEELSWLRKQIFTSIHSLEQSGRLTVNCGSQLKYVENIKNFIKTNVVHHSISVESIFVPSFMEMWYLLTVTV